jgi:NTE family protein
VGRLERKLRSLNLHLIENEELMAQLSAHSRLNVHPSFIHALRDAGRSRAELWLKRKFQFIGARSSFRLGRFLPPRLPRLRTVR